MKTNVDIYVNIMVEDRQHQDKNSYVPYDLLVERYPQYKNPSCEIFLTDKQREQKKTCIPCYICGKRCGGNCGVASVSWIYEQILDNGEKLKRNGFLEEQKPHLEKHVEINNFNENSMQDYVIRCALGIAYYCTDKMDNLIRAKNIFEKLYNLPEKENGDSPYKDARRLVKEYLEEIELILRNIREESA